MNINESIFSEKISALGGVQTIGGPRVWDKVGFDVKLVELENMIGGRFPVAFVEFAKEFGFARSNEFWEVRGIDKIPGAGDDNSVFVDVFFGVDPVKSNQQFSMEYMLDMYEEQLPKKYVPICGGGPGDLICLSLNKPNSGKIYYWCHEEPEDQNLFLIANSFTEFIENLEIFVFDSTRPQPKVVGIRVTAKGLEMLEKFRKRGPENSNGDTIE